MRPRVLAGSFVLTLVMAAPAWAQPFADTPATHWARDALATPAAKGLIEGYPDGTFKGDRSMTRYEMAMVVARLLARIESAQVQAPGRAAAQPEISGEDLDLILFLVNELRQELTDKNVRLAPVEEALNALKARSTNVRITGATQFRYDITRAASGIMLPWRRFG